MIVFSTKCALSKGVEEYRCNPPQEGSEYVRPEGCFSSLRLGKDAHKTREEAVKAAEKMRVKKIASLRKQIERLDSLTF